MGTTPDRRHERWANLRHSIIGALLAAPPRRGELRAAIEALAAKTWQHPMTGKQVRFAYSTLERWLYLARRAGHADTVNALRRRIRKDAGTRRAVSAALVAAALVAAVVQQHRDHPTWSYQLHAENLVALAELDAALGHVPSYTTVRRLMKARGLFRQKHWRHGTRAGDSKSRAIFRVARDPQLRVRARARPVAPRLPHREAHPHPARERRVGRAEDPGDPR